jgi:hypothetical protein
MNRRRLLFLLGLAVAAGCLLAGYNRSGRGAAAAKPVACEDPSALRRADALPSAYATAPPDALLRALASVRGGPEAPLFFQALALRKAELLSPVRERLRSGEMFERFMLTKFLRYCPWPETMPELVALARDRTQYWMPRQGALYALGALGDPAAGTEVEGILRATDEPAGVRLAAIAALARMGCRDAADAIRPYLQHDDPHFRLFAARALAMLGEPADPRYPIEALQHEDYIVRQEACGALGAMSGPDVVPKLEWAAVRDPHEAVRDAASQALLEHKMRGRTTAAKAGILRDALNGAELHTATWILRCLLEEGGAEGRALVEERSKSDDRLGERARSYLLMAASHQR